MTINTEWKAVKAEVSTKTITAIGTVNGNPAAGDSGIIPPSFKLVYSTEYPDNKTYSGVAQRWYASFYFAPSDWPGVKWYIDKVIAKHFAIKIMEQGLKPLTLKLYEDGFKYIIVIEASGGLIESVSYSKSYPQAAALAGIIGAIILAALVLAGIVVIALTVIKTEEFFKEMAEKAPAMGFGLILLGLGVVAVIGIAVSRGRPAKGYA